MQAVGPPPRGFGQKSRRAPTRLKEHKYHAPSIAIRPAAGLTQVRARAVLILQLVEQLQRVAEIYVPSSSQSRCSSTQLAACSWKSTDHFGNTCSEGAPLTFFFWSDSQSRRRRPPDRVKHHSPSWFMRLGVARGPRLRVARGRRLRVARGPTRLRVARGPRLRV